MFQFSHTHFRRYAALTALCCSITTLFLPVGRAWAACMQSCGAPCGAPCPCPKGNYRNPRDSNSCISKSDYEQIQAEIVHEENQNSFNSEVIPTVNKQNAELHKIGSKIYDACESYAQSIPRQMGLLYMMNKVLSGTDSFGKDASPTFQFPYSLFEEDREENIYPAIYRLLDANRIHCLRLYTGIVPTVAGSFFDTLTAYGVSLDQLQGLSSYVAGSVAPGDDAVTTQKVVNRNFATGAITTERKGYTLRGVRRYTYASDGNGVVDDPARLYVLSANDGIRNLGNGATSAAHFRLMRDLFEENDLVAVNLTGKESAYQRGHALAITYGLETSMGRLLRGGVHDVYGEMVLDLMDGTTIERAKAQGASVEEIQNLLADRILLAGRFEGLSEAPSTDWDAEEDSIIGAGGQGLHRLYYSYSQERQSLYSEDELAGMSPFQAFQLARSGASNDSAKYGTFVEWGKLQERRDFYRAGLLPFTDETQFRTMFAGIWNIGVPLNEIEVPGMEPVSPEQASEVQSAYVRAALDYIQALVLNFFGLISDDAYHGAKVAYEQAVKANEQLQRRRRHTKRNSDAFEMHRQRRD